jgi:integrase
MPADDRIRQAGVYTMRDGVNNVIALPVPRPPQQTKSVEADQKAIDALPPGSGEWKVKGILGLLVWCGAKTKSFRLVRRVNKRLVKKTLAARSLAEARREAIRVWKNLKPRPASEEPMPTLAEALQAYLETKRLAERTRAAYEKFIKRYLADWLERKLDELAFDRRGFRKRIAEIERHHGAATAALVLRIYRAIHNWHRKVIPDLPESPTTACDAPRVKPRDWALSDEELRAWWERVRQLPPTKRAWWTTALFTGARATSITNLRWDDIDFERRVIVFRVTKGDRPYAVPMADRLADFLREYREKDWLPNEAGWVFPSPRNPERPLYSQVKNQGLRPPHSLRHSMRTRLAEAGAPPDLAKIALGHSLSQSVSERYLTPSLLIEAVRPLVNRVAEIYCRVMGWQ